MQSFYLMGKGYVFAEKLKRKIKAKYKRKMKVVCPGELDNRNRSMQSIKLVR